MTSSSANPNPSSASPRERARRLGLGAVAVASVLLTTILTLRVLSRTLWPDASPSAEACEVGVRRLYLAVERARGRAEISTQGEATALAAFRDALEPEWTRFDSVAKRCTLDRTPAAQSALRQVELLRYAEERTVRYQALDLSRLRRNTPLVVESLGSPASPLTIP